jgi:uncharacterized RDD family membrane protein YckC
MFPVSELPWSRYLRRFQRKIEKCYSNPHPSLAKDRRVTDSLSSTARPAGFWLRFAAAVIDLVVLAVPFAVFVSFLSVGMRMSIDFLDLRPGMPPSEVLMRFGPRFLYISVAFFVVLSWAYFAGLESSSWRATLGKRVMGLYVADTQGCRVTFVRASGRFLGGRFLAHAPPFGLYYFLFDCLCAGFTPRRQALHDTFARCLVLRQPSTGGLTPLE